MEPAVLNYIDGDSTVFEREPLEHLARDGQLAAYKHRGFWQPMDTLRDKMHLEDCGKKAKPRGNYGNRRGRFFHPLFGDLRG